VKVALIIVVFEDAFMSRCHEHRRAAVHDSHLPQHIWAHPLLATRNFTALVVTLYLILMSSHLLFSS
jgi:hypothetical protein